jgi:hypothetical protein
MMAPAFIIVIGWLVVLAFGIGAVAYAMRGAIPNAVTAKTDPIDADRTGRPLRR